jgi:hypothetical protein
VGRRPIHQFLEGFRVADPEVVGRAQGKERSEDSGELLVRGKFHRKGPTSCLSSTSGRKLKRESETEFGFAYYFLLASGRRDA